MTIWKNDKYSIASSTKKENETIITSHENVNDALSSMDIKSVSKKIYLLILINQKRITQCRIKW
jgi:hypothetical protein